MKKNLLCLSAILFFISGNAQNWNLNTTGTFGLSTFTSRSIASYKNQLYVGGGYGSADAAKIMVSNNGNTSTYNEDYNFSSIITGTNTQFVKVLKNSSAGNYLFAGTYTSADDPHVFRYDGSTWMDFGNIPWVVGDSSWYDGISAMGLFTASGTNDTLYVAITPSSNGTSNNIGPQIYRTSINNISWQFVDSLPVSTGSIYDMITFQSKLFYSTDNYARVFASANGTNFTAVSDTGFYDASPISGITSLEVYNNELYAAGSAMDSCEIWKSADGSNWTRCGIRGLALDPGVSQVHDMVAYNGLLYVMGIDIGMGAKPIGSNPVINSMSVISVYSWNGTSFTNTGLDAISTYSYSGGWFMNGFKNALYVGGEDYLSNNDLYKGCFPSTAVFSFNTDTTCLYTSIKAGSTSTGIGDHNWYLDTTSSIFYVGDTLFTGFSSTGMHYVRLQIVNGACVDSSMDSIYVKPEFTIDSLTPSNPSVCSGQSVNFVVYPNASSGTLPYTYQWSGSNSSSIGTTQAISYVPSGTEGYVDAYVTDANGCQAYASTGTYVNSSTDISGAVSYSSGPVIFGDAYLIKHGAFAAQWDTVQVVTINSQTGIYTFSNVNSGDYIIRAEADTSFYPALVNTYYGNQYIWDSAHFATHGCAITDSFPIVMIEIVPVSGPGSISGYVYEGTGFGQKIIPGNPVPFTNVIPGVPVKVGKNPSGTIVASTTTDTSGYYHFDNLPYDNYTIYTDIPGYPMDSSYVVSLTAGSDSAVDLNYFVDSNSVYIEITTSIKNTEAKTSAFNVYPNPTSGQIKIQLGDVKNLSGVIRLFDLSGRVIYTVKENNLFSGQIITLDISSIGLSSGTYFLDIAGYNEKCRIVLINK